MKRALIALACALACAAPPAHAADLDLETLDGPTAVKLMDEGKLTSVELTRAYIARIAALNKSGPGLNAVSQLNADALKDAALLDKERREGKVRGPAHGLPVLLKDLIDVKGMYTSAGNFSLRNSFPAIDYSVRLATSIALEGYRANVRTMIKRIRQKFRNVDGEFDEIRNYPGFGYRWGQKGGVGC